MIIVELHRSCARGASDTELTHHDTRQRYRSTTPGPGLIQYEPCVGVVCVHDLWHKQSAWPSSLSLTVHQQCKSPTCAAAQTPNPYWFIETNHNKQPYSLTQSHSSCLRHLIMALWEGVQHDAFHAARPAAPRRFASMRLQLTWVCGSQPTNSQQAPSLPCALSNLSAMPEMACLNSTRHDSHKTKPIGTPRTVGFSRNVIPSLQQRSERSK